VRPVRYELFQNATQSCPIYSAHKKARNWAATVSRDVTAPGGFAREFWQWANGDDPVVYYIAPLSIARGDVVEWGSNLYKGYHNVERMRRYSVVLSVERDEDAIHAITVATYRTFGEANRTRKAVIADPDFEPEEAPDYD
jgi:hypothetical protein